MTDLALGSLTFGDHTISTLELRPPEAHALLMLAHGAGAGMDHAFMDDLAQALSGARIATLRYNFPYWERRGSGPPDRAPTLVSTVLEVARHALERADGLPLFAGGKSMGGRMSTTAASTGDLPRGVRGVVCFGFPLHRPKAPSTGRAKHLSDVDRPILMLQGTRDAMADTELIRQVAEDLGPSVRLHWVEGADHGFHVLKRSGRTDTEVIEELAAEAANFMREVGG